MSGRNWTTPRIAEATALASKGLTNAVIGARLGRTEKAIECLFARIGYRRRARSPLLAAKWALATEIADMKAHPASRPFRIRPEEWPTAR